MPGMARMEWDSRMCGLRVGRVADVERVPTPADLSGFDTVLARFPQENTALAVAYEAAGFRFVTIDFTVSKAVLESGGSGHAEFELRVLRKQAADFPFAGFSVEGSRLYLDPSVLSGMS